MSLIEPATQRQLRFIEYLLSWHGLRGGERDQLIRYLSTNQSREGLNRHYASRVIDQLRRMQAEPAFRDSMLVGARHFR